MKSSELKRTSPLQRGEGPKRSQPRRDWAHARAKVEREAACRFCGREIDPRWLQACHIIGRERDEFLTLLETIVDLDVLEALHFPPPKRLFQPWTVHPNRIVPGCRTCHKEYDDGERDLLGKLRLEEELQAVHDCRFAGHSGIENARVRTCPSQYRKAS